MCGKSILDRTQHGGYSLGVATIAFFVELKIALNKLLLLKLSLDKPIFLALNRKFLLVLIKTPNRLRANTPGRSHLSG